MRAGLHSAGTAEFVHSDAPVRPAPTALTAFVGRTLKGPVDRPIPVIDFAHFTQHFGGLCPESPLSYAVEQFFEHGGGSALIVRVSSGGRPPTLDLPAGDGCLSFAGLAWSFFPYIVPEQITLFQAASSPESLSLILIGAAFVLPVILAYTVLAWRIFGGKAMDLRYD